MSNFTPEQIQEILDIYFENFAHRQYIGARYVPIFGRKGETSIEWDNSAPYEPLTIVLHEGNSYTSRQFVPTGVAITNSAYWAETGNYNAQIEQYREEVIAIQNQIGDGFDSENTVADAVDSINGKIGTGFTSENTVADAIAATYVNNPVYNVKAYGAKGDGVTDDTAAFQAAIDAAGEHYSGKVYIPMSEGEKYIVSETLNIDSPYITLYSNGARNIGWPDSGIHFNSEDDILFNVTVTGIVFNNLVIRAESTGNTCINAEMASYPDTDIDIIQCDFTHFLTVINHYDRGLLFKDNITRHCTDAIVINKDNLLPDTGQDRQRGIRIIGNRFHGVDKAVKIVDSTPYGMVINDNLLDFSENTSEANTILYADATTSINTAQICNNVILESRDYTIQILNKIDNAQICNNNIMNRVTNVDGRIKIKSASNVIIDDNVFGGCSQHAIIIETLLTVKINDNNFLNTAQSDADNYACVYIPTSLSQTQICNNIMVFNSSSQSRCIKYAGTSAVEWCRITENTSRRTEIFTNVNSATVSNCKIQTDSVS